MIKHVVVLFKLRAFLVKSPIIRSRTVFPSIALADFVPQRSSVIVKVRVSRGLTVDWLAVDFPRSILATLLQVSGLVIDLCSLYPAGDGSNAVLSACPRTPPPKIALLQQQPLARVLDELSAGLDQVAGSWVSGHLATRIGSANRRRRFSSISRLCARNV
jgi:hypothetical protein